MIPQKSPFVGYTLDQIIAAEASGYVIQVGSDMFYYKGRYTFTHKSAVYFRNKILANLTQLINQGDTAQRENALKCVRSLIILPLRIQ